MLFPMLPPAALNSRATAALHMPQGQVHLSRSQLHIDSSSLRWTRRLSARSIGRGGLPYVLNSKRTRRPTRSRSLSSLLFFFCSPLPLSLPLSFSLFDMRHTRSLPVRQVAVRRRHLHCQRFALQRQYRLPRGHIGRALLRR